MVVIGVEQGIVLAIVASIIDHLRRSYRPGTSVIRPADGGGWTSAPVTPDARTLPGLVVYRFAGSVYYANAGLLFEQASRFANSSAPPRWFCLDAAAIPDIDYSGGETIKQLQGQLEAHGIKLVVAEAMDMVSAELDRYGITELLGDDAFFPSVHDAVQRFEELNPAGDH